MPVAVVTDSTASLPAEVAADRGITVVPLQVVIGAHAYEEGIDEEATPAHVAEALAAFTPVSTSRPTPAAFEAAYRAAAESGASHVVSVHLSGEISGTFESAQLGARKSPIPVTCIDTRQVGMGVGFAALAAVDAADAGADAVESAQAARTRAALTTSLFYVDTLEYLRRGGRMGAAAAIVGSALAVKPILTISEGRVVVAEKVRTSSRALARLEELAVAAAGDADVEAAVAHLAAPDRADQLAERLGAHLPGLGERSVWTGEVGAVLGAHVGPGMVAVCVAHRDSSTVVAS